MVNSTKLESRTHRPASQRAMKSSSFKDQLREFLLLSLDRCMKAVNARSGSIFLIDENTKELVLEIAKSGSSESTFQGVRARLGERIAGRVALERKPFLVENIDNEPSLKYTPKYDHYRTKSFLSVPLECSGRLLGVINVADKQTDTSFDFKDLNVITEISNHLSIALHTLRGYSEQQAVLEQKLNEELKLLSATIERSKKYSSIGKLVGGIVHEINNPLDGVIRYVNLACGAVESGVSKEYLEEARRGLIRIATIVRSLLDFCWSLSPAEGELDINSTIEECLFMLNHYIISCNIKLTKQFASGLPKLPDYRLKLVFNNIIKNACEVMKQGGELAITTALNGSVVEIVVEDTGPGIPHDIKDKIFDPFFTTKSMGEGSGLGLAISYEIIQRYQGEIFAETKQHGGARFLIRLPLPGALQQKDNG